MNGYTFAKHLVLAIFVPLDVQVLKLYIDPLSIQHSIIYVFLNLMLKNILKYNIHQAFFHLRMYNLSNLIYLY